MTFYHNTPENVSLLSKLTNIPSEVCNQWLLCEGQATNNPTNPLNIIALDYPGYPERGRIKQTGKLGNFGVYASAAQGIEDAAWLVNYGYVGRPIRAAVAASKSALEIAEAIENSGWAAGHYGHSCISSHFKNNAPVVEEDEMKPLVLGNIREASGSVEIVGEGHTVIKLADSRVRGNPLTPGAIYKVAAVGTLLDAFDDYKQHKPGIDVYLLTGYEGLSAECILSTDVKFIPN